MQGIFKAVTLFCMILHWWIHDIIHSSKPIEYTTPRVNPNINYGLQVMCPPRFISHNKCSAPVGDVSTVGEAVHV